LEIRDAIFRARDNELELLDTRKNLIQARNTLYDLIGRDPEEDAL
jgi:outer membrane protein TolC